MATQIPGFKQIPTFKLYGENLDWPTPDLLHWESVAERSRLHNWKIRPHRHSGLLQLIYVQSGEVRAQLDGETHNPDAPCLLLLPPLCVHGFEFSSDVQGHVLTLAAPLMEELAGQLNSQTRLFKTGKICFDRAQELAPVFAAMAAEYCGQRPYRDWALQTSVGQVVIWLARHEAESPAHREQRLRKSSKHLDRFNQLVERHFREHLPLAQYAQRLNISAAHLNSVCRELAQRSALQIVHDRLLLEAKRNLVYTSMTVSEIACSLGFSEPAYFTRFFKRLNGLSPQEFRRGSASTHSID